MSVKGVDTNNTDAFGLHGSDHVPDTMAGELGP